MIHGFMQENIRTSFKKYPTRLVAQFCEMSFQNQILLLVVIINCLLGPYLFGDCKVFVKKCETYDENDDYTIKFKFLIKTVDSKQYVNSTLVFTTPVDNNIKSNVSIDTLVGNQYVYLFSINENKACDAMNKYFGEFWYDLERHAGIIPGLCPIAKGRYHLHNYLLDWDKMATLRNFPLGNLRFTFVLKNNKNIIITRFVLELSNQI